MTSLEVFVKNYAQRKENILFGFQQKVIRKPEEDREQHWRQGKFDEPNTEMGGIADVRPEGLEIPTCQYGPDSDLTEVRRVLKE